MPRIIGNMPTDRWENCVLQELKKQLPNDWIVMPNVVWTLTKGPYVRDGEADFVVLIPNSGLVVVEVKGSKSFKVDGNGIWMRKSYDNLWVQLKEPPPAQAMRNMHDLTGVLKESNHWNEFPGRFSYLVIYPQGEAESLPPMFDESTIATRRHVSQLASRLRNSIEKRGGDGLGKRFTPQVMEAVIDVLKNRLFHVHKVDTKEDVASDVRGIDLLTRQQFASLKGLFQLPNVAIIGPAGSGKTVLAMWKLKAWLDQGKNCIYVCFNRHLADRLRQLNSDEAQSIWNIDKLFLEMCPEYKSRAGNADFHREELPNIVLDRAHEFTKYDAIIVDEGQDFSEEQVIALLELLADDGSWAFFADWKQDLYGAGQGRPLGAEVIFHLHHNCRNTIKINEASNHYLDSKVESMPGMPVGVPPALKVAKLQADKAWELAHQWAGEGTVAILSPYKLENSAMKNQKAGYNLSLSTKIQDLGVKGKVLFSTIKSFKGIEADSVIVVDVDIPENKIGFSREDLYVACTRAKTRLALVSSNKDVIDYYRF